VNDEAGRQPVTGREPRLAGRAAAKLAAFLEELRTGSAVNGAIDPAATEKRRIGRVDDGIHSERRDVGNDHVKISDNAVHSSTPSQE
jgi:hypothetical protein